VDAPSSVAARSPSEARELSAMRAGTAFAGRLSQEVLMARVRPPVSLLLLSGLVCACGGRPIAASDDARVDRYHTEPADGTGPTLEAFCLATSPKLEEDGTLWPVVRVDSIRTPDRHFTLSWYLEDDYRLSDGGPIGATIRVSISGWLAGLEPGQEVAVEQHPGLLLSLETSAQNFAGGARSRSPAGRLPFTGTLQLLDEGSVTGLRACLAADAGGGGTYRFFAHHLDSDNY
jgi:hypothetical protein